MILSFIYVFAAIIVQMFTSVLNALNWQFPNSFLGTFQTFFGIVNFFGGFLPFIADIIAIILILVPAWVIRYIFNILLWAWSLVPWIGSHTQAPKGTTMNIHRDFGEKKFYVTYDKS